MHGKIVYIQNGLIILVSIAFYLKCEYKLEHYFISYCSSTDMRITIPLPSTTPRIAPGIGPCDNFKTTSDISLNPHPMTDWYTLLNTGNVKKVFILCLYVYILGHHFIKPSCFSTVDKRSI